MELIYKLYVLDNVSNWRVFKDDEQIINFLTMEDTFKDSMIDEEKHDVEIKEESDQPSNVSYENFVPRLVLKLETFYDL